jgi:hypothetical protein
MHVLVACLHEATKPAPSKIHMGCSMKPLGWFRTASLFLAPHRRVRGGNMEFKEGRAGLSLRNT